MLSLKNHFELTIPFLHKRWPSPIVNTQDLKKEKKTTFYTLEFA